MSYWPDLAEWADGFLDALVLDDDGEVLPGAVEAALVTAVAQHGDNFLDVHGRGAELALLPEKLGG